MAEVFFNSTAGRIQGDYNASPNRNRPIALILHPNPLHEGSMNNKVVYEMYKQFVSNDFSVLRINFRGVGKSQGTFDGGVGELIDAASALDWLEDRHQDGQYWVAGFSFGAWIAMELAMRRPEIMRFVLATPPVNKYDFSFLSPCPAPGLIVQGNLDSVVSESAVAEFVDKTCKNRNTNIKYHVINGADHFFRGKLSELGVTINTYIQRSLLEKNDPSADSSSKDDKVVLLD